MEINKKNYTTEYTEEQKAFIRKYGESSLDSWERMNESQRREYQEIENYYSIFTNLLSEHYEDLKLYALMYRNVALYNCDKDPISVLFFASKQNEIIGFKKKLQAEKESDKAKIAFLFYENMALFPKVVKKYTDINLKPFQFTNQVIYHSILNDFNDGDYAHIFSLCDLDNSNCNMILSNVKNLNSEYISLYNDCEEEYYSPNNFADINDFIRKYFIPNILKDNTSFQNKRILRYIRMKYSKKWREEITFLRRYYEEYVQQIESYIIEKNKQILYTHQEPVNPRFEYFSVYSFDIKELKTIKNRLEIEISLESNRVLNKTRYIDIDNIDLKKIAEGHKELQDKCLKLKNRIREVESKIEKFEKLEKLEYSKWLERGNRLEKQRYEEQERLKKETERIDRLKEQAYEILILRIKSSGLFDFVYINYKEIEQYVITSCEKLYNILWLRKPEYMKELEFRTTSTNSIRNIFDSDYKKRKDAKFFYYIRHKITNEEKIILRERGLMKKWCEIIDKEYDEAQRIKKEKERIQEEKRIKEEERKRQEEEARRAKFEYNKRNKHYRDSNISFDESTHLYKVDGVTLQSVTNFVNGCFPEFDAEFHAKRQAERTGKSVEEILKIWADKGEETRILGTALHKRIENYYQDILFSNADDKAFSLFKQFANRITLEPYRTEWAVYDEKYNLAGTIDFVDYQNGEYIIYDWKRSDKIIDNGIPIKCDKYGEKGKYPLEHLDNTPYYHYALQLSLYKFILENNYGIKVSDLRLGIFHPVYDKPYILRMPYLEKEINDIFGLRSEVLF